MDRQQKYDLILKQIHEKFNGKVMLTKREVADYLSITPVTLQKLTEQNAAPKAIKLGRRLRYSVGSLASFLVDNEL